MTFGFDAPTDPTGPASEKQREWFANDSDIVVVPKVCFVKNFGFTVLLYFCLKLTSTNLTILRFKSSNIWQESDEFCRRQRVSYMLQRVQGYFSNGSTYDDVWCTVLMSCASFSWHEARIDNIRFAEKTQFWINFQVFLMRKPIDFVHFFGPVLAQRTQISIL